MAELFRARCKQGMLIITESAIIVELQQAFGRNKGQAIKSETMVRSAFVDLDTKVPLLLSAGGTTNLTFHGQGGKVLHADLVKREDAERIRNIVTGRE